MNKTKICASCNRPILSYADIFTAGCDDIFHKSCYENLIAQASDANKIIPSCPQCGAALNTNYRSYQNNFINKQFISVTLTPCNDNFKLQTDKKVEIQNYYITKMNLKLFPYGFDGKVTISLPLKYYVTKIFDFLKERKPVQIKVDYFQQRMNAKKDRQTVSLTGFIDSNNGIEENFTSLYSREDKANKEKLNSYNACIKLKFSDSFKYFFSRHKPNKIYQDKTYSNILKEQLNDLKVSNIVSIKIDSAFKELNTKKDLIVLPFQQQDCSSSLYDFWFTTATLYGGYILLDEDGSYTVVNKKKSQPTKDNDINSFDKKFIPAIKFKHLQRCNSGLTVYNCIHLDGSNKYEVKSNNTEQAQAVFNSSDFTIQKYQSLFDMEKKHKETCFKNKFTLEYLTVIKVNGLPFYTKPYPNNQIKLNSDNWRKLFGDKDLTLSITEVNIKFEFQTGSITRTGIRNEDSLDENKIDTILAPQQDKQKQGVYPFTVLTTKLVCENSESKFAHLPKLKHLNYPATVNGIVVVPDDMSQKYNNKVPYMIFDGTSQIPADENTENKNSSSTAYSLSRFPEHFLSYHIKLPIYKENKDVIIAVPYLPNITSDQYFYPYKSNQPVTVNLYQEYGLISTLPQFTSTSNITKDKQINNHTFGPEQQGEFRFETGSSDETLSILKQELSAKTQKYLTMTNKTISLSFQDSE
jgi:hypothetical protein